MKKSRSAALEGCPGGPGARCREARWSVSSEHGAAKHEALWSVSSEHGAASVSLKERGLAEGAPKSGADAVLGEFPLLT